MFDLSEKSEEELWELTTGEDRDIRAEATHELAVRFDRSGRNEQAASLYGAAIDLWRTAGDVSEMARGSYNYGCFLIRHEEYADAIPFMADAVSGYREEAKYSWLADAYRWQAKAYSGVGDKDRALADFARAVEVYVDIEHYAPATIAQLEVVELLGFLDRQDEALAATESALEHAEASGDPYLPMRVNDRAAAALIDLGEYDLALERLRDCLGVAEYVNDTQAINYQSHRLGATLLLRGKFTEALRFLSRANEAFRRADNLNDVVETDLGVLECYFALGRNGKAKSLLRQLEAVTKPARFAQTRAAILMVRAEALVAAGNPRAADQLCTEALILADEVSDQLLARKVRILRAEALLEDSQFALAFDQIYDIPVADFGQNRVWRARLLTVRAAVRGPVEGHLTLAEFDIQENIALGAAVGFARSHGRSYEQLAAIRFSEGRRDDARTLQVKATAIYLRAGLTALAERAAANLLPDTYLLRIPSTGPFARPELISSGPASAWTMGRELEAMMAEDYDAGISEGRRNVAIGSEMTTSDGSRNDTRPNETRLNETRLNETRLNETRLNETRLNETRLNETRLNETRLNETSKREPSMSDGSRNDRSRNDPSRNSSSGNADNDNDSAA